MIGTLSKILKKILGDKTEKDLQEIYPLVEEINKIGAGLVSLSNDELRAKTAVLRERVSLFVKGQKEEVERLRTKAESDSSVDIDAQEQIYEQIDKLEKEIDALLEEVLAEILPEAFAVVKETARRFTEHSEIEVSATEFDRDLAARKDAVEIRGEKAVWRNEWLAAGLKVHWNMVHYDVQLIGGIALHRGKVAEMQTGEGKTLVSTLPVYLNALAGRGVHVITVNDYLAKRDAEWMGTLHEFHGLKVDCIDKYRPNSEERRAAYKADITYGTNNEFGFDYLRDNMAVDPAHLVQRKHHYAIVDEVDSVLIDEARTPLIISGPTQNGDKHEFNELKPKVQLLYGAQKQIVTQFLSEAKQRLSGLSEGKVSKEDMHEGGLSLFRAFRGLPKNKALIKFLSEEGVKQQLLKTEAFYMQDNSREMWKADQELFFVIDEKNNQVELTEKGIALISKNMDDEHFFVMPDVGTEIAVIEKESLSDDDKLIRKDELMRDFSIKSERIHTMNQLLKAYALFEKDVNYVVMDHKVSIVDEQTGRIMEGRRYSDGLHQAIESKENVTVEAATQTHATVTLQNYFRMYHKLAGMTGTAETEAGELWDIYKLDVMIIPTNRKVIRKDIDDKVYRTKREKYNAVIDDVLALKEAGRPVLVGTTTVEVSELLSKMLHMRNIEHQVLNAKLHQREADIVANAGLPGTVTIATNMAGRGTDIKLGQGVKEAGGLAIIGTERHDSRRVDRQLRGRSGRQGDPGSSQFYVSLEDDLMRIFGSDRIAKMMDRLGIQEGEVIQHSMITKSIERAQKKVEENNFGIRKRLLEYDDVMNAQREVIYKRRRHALFGERLKLDIVNTFYDLSENLIATHQMSKSYEALSLDVVRYFGIAMPFDEDAFISQNPAFITNNLFQAANEHYVQKSALMAAQALPVIKGVYDDQGNNYHNILIPFTDGIKNMDVVVNLEKSVETAGVEIADALERGVTLAIIDQEWKDHLRNMDDLRSNVQFAQHEQKDPLLIYKFESYELFKGMVNKVNAEVASFLVKCIIRNQEGVQQARRPAPKLPENLRTSKDSVENLNERNMAAQRSAQQGASKAPQVQPVRVEKKVARNEPCPCGSGKKYKQCHGKDA